MDEGYCQCGCGRKTTIIRQNNSSRDLIKGMPRRYIHGHNNANHRKYPTRKVLGHPRSNPSGYVQEHILLAEKALGKPLPAKAVVHHHTPDQLAICQDQAYHLFIERRTRAYRACGHADWRKCWICKQWDDPKNLYIQPNKSQANHRHCHAAEMNKRKCAHVSGCLPNLWIILAPRLKGIMETK